MDFALFDLFNGSTVASTIHTRAGFVKAVDATTVGDGMKHYAGNFQDAVWDKCASLAQSRSLGRTSWNLRLEAESSQHK